MIRVLLVFFLLPLPLVGSEGIANDYAHSKNQRIVSEVMKRYPSPEAVYSNIGEIGQEILKKGFNTSAYRYTDYLSYTMTCVWEGRHSPVSLFIFVWPPECLVKDKSNLYWCTPIHGHPIPCAFTVLEGAITQKTYQVIPGGVKIDQIEDFLPGQGANDDNSQQFVHQLMCLDEKSAITLHAYGAGTNREVHKIFWETREQYAY